MRFYSILKHFSEIKHFPTLAREPRIIGPLMAEQRLRHRVEYTRNKHSRAICKGNTIIIRLARNLSRTEEQDHIQNLLRRMTHLVLQEQQKTMVSPFDHLLNGGQTQTVTLARGRTIHLSLVPGIRTKAERTMRGWNISVSPQIRRRALHRFLWSLIAKVEQERITKQVHDINHETFRVPVRTVRLRFASTQWGSCSPKGVLMLNVALLFLPPSLLRYVIIHELAHRIHSNHSPAYWREVKRVLPQYRRAYEALQEYRLPQG